MSNMNQGKIVKRCASVRFPMIARGPVVRHQVDPILVQSTRTTDQPEQAPIYFPQYKLTQEPMLPSVSFFFGLFEVFRSFLTIFLAIKTWIKTWQVLAKTWIKTWQILAKTWIKTW